MKRTMFALLALTFLVSSAGLSTVTRVKTMGRVNQYVLDDANVFLYPSMLVKYSDRFLFDAGEDGTLPLSQQSGIRGFNGISGGVFFGVTPYSHVGFIVNANDRTAGNGISVGVPASGYTHPVLLDDFVGLFYAYDAAKMDFGVEFDYAGSKVETTEPEASEQKDDVSRIGLRAGITYGMQNDDQLDIAFTYLNTSFTEESPNPAGDPNTVAESDGYNTIGVSARLFHEMNEDYTLVPVFEWFNAKQGVSIDTDGDGDMETDETKTNTIRASVGANLTPSERVLVVTAAGIQIASGETTVQGDKVSESSSDYIPFLKAGIEAEVKSWADFRAGVEKQLTSSSIEAENENSPDTESSGADFQGFVGAGFYLADLIIDVQIDTGFLWRGPYFISGANSSGMNSRISLMYPF